MVLRRSAAQTAALHVQPRSYTPQTSCSLGSPHPKTPEARAPADAVFFRGQKFCSGSFRSGQAVVLARNPDASGSPPPPHLRSVGARPHPMPFRSRHPLPGSRPAAAGASWPLPRRAALPSPVPGGATSREPREQPEAGSGAARPPAPA
ncbi:PREDICTED: skin secretory protein xP2-like, partial [Chinchilla lanigera]|uniref:skin secretory protein xP2-like n=1 Tax=Chinchilla lanigera TaxID=34839 RepID=UPI0006977869